MTARLLLVAVAATALAPPAFAQPNAALPRANPISYPPGYFKYGPSWLDARASPESFGHIFGPKRPEKLDRAVTTTNVSRDGNGIGVAIDVWGDVPELVKGRQYQLRYQLRLHTKKGVEGPLLGTAASPKGIGPILCTVTAGDDWNGLEASVDVTRKDLSGMTNLPDVKSGRQEVFVRFEPQIFDLTSGAFLTPRKTDAVILEVTVGPNRQVLSVLPPARWVHFKATFRDAEDLKPALDSLDGYRTRESGITVAVVPQLLSEFSSAKKQVRLIEAIPVEACDDFVGHDRMSDVLGALEQGKKPLDPFREVGPRTSSGPRSSGGPASSGGPPDPRTPPPVVIPYEVVTAAKAKMDAFRAYQAAKKK